MIKINKNMRLYQLLTFLSFYIILAACTDCGRVERSDGNIEITDCAANTVPDIRYEHIIDGAYYQCTVAIHADTVSIVSSTPEENRTLILQPWQIENIRQLIAALNPVTIPCLCYTPSIMVDGEAYVLYIDGNRILVAPSGVSIYPAEIESLRLYIQNLINQP